MPSVPLYASSDDSLNQAVSTWQKKIKNTAKSKLTKGGLTVNQDPADCKNNKQFRQKSRKEIFSKKQKKQR